ncbi:MAG: Cu(I)/Ag(I) efflux system membrane fusion protein [Sphingobacteriales bacterium]|jgi:Cu(I)/Ag(I) efflux system membrane fusion protein
MKTIKAIFGNQWVKTGLILGVGIILGSWFFGGDSAPKKAEISEGHDHSTNSVWTCSMHPQIRQDEPGLCPICAMDLIPVDNSAPGNSDDPGQVSLTEAATILAQIQTVTINKGTAEKEITLQGKVRPDERTLSEVSARFSGRIEKLFVNFTGEEIKRGQKIATLYSPEILSAQQELIEAISIKESSPALYNAVVRKLELWGVTSAQIQRIEETKKADSFIDIYSPQTGTVIERPVAEGDYIKEGTTLFKIANLSSVWVVFDVYESDLPWLKNGARINFSVNSLPGQDFKGKISFIDPMVDEKSRVAGARVELSNPSSLLKPGMFVRGEVTARLNTSKSALMIPKSAVLWTGKRAVVYVQDPNSKSNFFFREIALGAESGDYYVVNSGLEEGEKVVSNGAFKVDAAAQLAGKKSMMNQPSTVKKAKVENWKGNPELSENVSAIIDGYLILKEALSSDRPDFAKDEGKKILSLMGDLNASSLTGKSRDDFNAKKSVLKKALTKIASTESIDDQRMAFLDLSTVVVDWSKKVEEKLQKILYVKYCPMANNNNGGQWLSDKKNIENPYFGKKMHKCGAITNTLTN